MHISVESSHGQTVVEGAGNEFFSEAEARKQSWVTLGILALAGLVTVGNWKEAQITTNQCDTE